MVARKSQEACFKQPHTGIFALLAEYIKVKIHLTFRTKHVIQLHWNIFLGQNVMTRLGTGTQDTNLAEGAGGKSTIGAETLNPCSPHRS